MIYIAVSEESKESQTDEELALESKANSEEDLSFDSKFTPWQVCKSIFVKITRSRPILTYTAFILLVCFGKAAVKHGSLFMLVLQVKFVPYKLKRYRSAQQ